MGALLGTLGAIVGLFIGVVVDERLFSGTPEWTSAITPLLFAFAGWGTSRALLRRRAGRRRNHMTY